MEPVKIPLVLDCRIRDRPDKVRFKCVSISEANACGERWYSFETMPDPERDFWPGYRINFTIADPEIQALFAEGDVLTLTTE